MWTCPCTWCQLVGWQSWSWYFAPKVPKSVIIVAEKYSLLINKWLSRWECCKTLWKRLHLFVIQQPQAHERPSCVLTSLSIQCQSSSVLDNGHGCPGTLLSLFGCRCLIPDISSLYGQVLSFVSFCICAVDWQRGNAEAFSLTTNMAAATVERSVTALLNELDCIISLKWRQTSTLTVFGELDIFCCFLLHQTLHCSNWL